MITGGGAAYPPADCKLAWRIVLGVLGGALVFTAHIDVGGRVDFVLRWTERG